MTWIADVAPRQTISSAQYGNPIRDRIVQTFADFTEAANRGAVLPNGATCHLDDTGLMYHKQAGLWRAMFPALIAGTIITGQGFFIAGGDTENVFTINLPAGYRMGQFHLQLHSNGNVPAGVNVDVRMTLNGGATFIGGATWLENQAATTHLAVATFPVNVAGEAGIVTVHNSNAPGTGDLLIDGNGYYTNYWAHLIP